MTVLTFSLTFIVWRLSSLLTFVPLHSLFFYLNAGVPSPGNHQTKVNKKPTPPFTRAPTDLQNAIVVPPPVREKRGAAASSKANPLVNNTTSAKAPAPHGMPTTATWYVGRMDRKKCERIVKASMPGDFLVRRSASSETEIICVNDFGEAANFAVSYVAGPMPVLYARKQFRTLDDAVQHAIARPLKSRLNKPLILQNVAVLDGWFRGDMKRRDCEDAIEYGEMGDFIVRKSSSGETYTLCVNDGGRSVSFSIKVAGRKNFIFRKEAYSSLEEVIDGIRMRPLKSKRGGKFHVVGPPECFDLEG